MPDHSIEDEPRKVSTLKSCSDASLCTNSLNIGSDMTIESEEKQILAPETVNDKIYADLEKNIFDELEIRLARDREIRKHEIETNNQVILTNLEDLKQSLEARNKELTANLKSLDDTVSTMKRNQTRIYGKRV